MLIAAIGVRTVSHSLTDLTKARMFADRKMTAWATPAASSFRIDRRSTVGSPHRRRHLQANPIIETCHRPTSEVHAVLAVLRPESLK
jgi:hypothetical protein